LLNRGADSVAENEEGRTALDIARQEGHDRIVAIMLEREFRVENGLRLPSPPPTPPSAPPMELMMDDRDAAGEEEEEDLLEWRCRLRDELERVDGDECAVEGEEAVEGGLERERIGTIDLRITWKSFEEEAKELMAQLEALRMQEVRKVKSQIVKAKREHEERLKKLDRQAKVLDDQARALEESVPRAREMRDERLAEKSQALAANQALIQNSEGPEARALAALQASQPQHSLLPCAKAKVEALKRFSELHALAIEQLRGESLQILADAEEAKMRCSTEEASVAEKLRIVADSLSTLARRRSDAQSEQEARLAELNEQLEKAERKSIVQAATVQGDGGGANHEEHWFGCPVCLTTLRPPTRIFQCPEGHILCEECKENPAMVHCPQCRCNLEGQLSRNRALEEVSRSYFPMAPSETL